MSTLSSVVLLFGYHTSTSSGPATGTAGTTPTSAGGDTATGSASSEPDTVTGAAASTRWGDVQVSITVSDGTITDVSVPVHPDENRKDVEINAYALPILIQDTISAQSADVDMVSGATVTSEGYVQSLQSALDAAGLS